MLGKRLCERDTSKQMPEPGDAKGSTRAYITGTTSVAEPGSYLYLAIADILPLLGPTPEPTVAPTGVPTAPPTQAETAIAVLPIAPSGAPTPQPSTGMLQTDNLDVHVDAYVCMRSSCAVHARVPPTHANEAIAVVPISPTSAPTPQPTIGNVNILHSHGHILVVSVFLRGICSYMIVHRLNTQKLL